MSDTAPKNQDALLYGHVAPAAAEAASKLARVAGETLPVNLTKRRMSSNSS